MWGSFPGSTLVQVRAMSSRCLSHVRSKFARPTVGILRNEVVGRAVIDLVGPQTEAPAVKREAEEDWGRP